MGIDGWEMERYFDDVENFEVPAPNTCGWCGRPPGPVMTEADQNARFKYWREREKLLEELHDRGFVANVTLDGSVIITGCRP